jgi:hypothetical protein
MYREHVLNATAGKDAPPPLEQMQTPPPPNVVPEKMLADFTLQGDIPLLYWYFNDRHFSNFPVHNSKETYEHIFHNLDLGSFYYYRNEGKAFFDALDRYPVKDRVVAVFGLAGCNCEAFAAWAGASGVIVVEYNKPVCEHPKIAVYNHEEFQALAVKTDFAISYSSFEHDGLGRYGDPLTPYGDLRAMRHTWDSLADDGILFLGLPLGQDCLVWNAHRIYGKLRLPMMLRGWQLLDVFCVYEEETPKFPFDMPIGEYRQQCLLVLRKIADDWPDDDYLLQNNKQKSKSLSSPAIFNRINKMVFEHKHAISSVNHE